MRLFGRAGSDALSLQSAPFDVYSSPQEQHRLSNHMNI